MELRLRSVGLSAKRNAAHLRSTGNPERSSDLVQRQTISEYVVVDKHALPADVLDSSNPQGVAQRTFGNALAIPVPVPYHPRRGLVLHDDGFSRYIERPSCTRRRFGRRTLKHPPRVVEAAPARPHIGRTCGDDIEPAEELALLLKEPGHYSAEYKGPSPPSFVLVSVDRFSELSSPHRDGEVPAEPAVVPVAHWVATRALARRVGAVTHRTPARRKRLHRAPRTRIAQLSRSGRVEHAAAALPEARYLLEALVHRQTSISGSWTRSIARSRCSVAGRSSRRMSPMSFTSCTRGRSR
jgi:hypothetical protein